MPFLFCALVVASILLLYTAYDKNEKAIVLARLAAVLSFDDWRHSLSELNKAFGLAGIGLASMSMILGPLAAAFGRPFASHLWWRKPLGLAAFAFMLLHVLYAVVVHYRLSAAAMLVRNDQLLGVLAAWPAFLIFLAMALTSNGASVRRLGAERWKALHRLGYLALAFSVLHFGIMETRRAGPLEVRPYALVFFLLPIVTLVLKYVPVHRWHLPGRPHRV
jgi:sulfoxide reductase heme-binding subunit YedZ